MGKTCSDGDLDLVTANATANMISVALNNGVGLFGTVSAVSVSAALSVVQLADVDGDSDLALLTSALNLGLGGKRVDSVVGVGMQGFEYVATGGEQVQLRVGQGV